MIGPMNMKKIFTQLFLLTVLSATCVGQIVIENMKYKLNDEDSTAMLLPREGHKWQDDKHLDWHIKANNITYTLTSIGAETFWDNTELKSIYIPNSVDSIGDLAFGNCTGLKDIYIQEYETKETVITVKEKTFFNITISNIYLHVPKSNLTAYKAHATWRNFKVASDPTARTGLKYNGSAQALVNAGTPPSSLKYQYSTDDSNWSEDIPKGTNIGYYTVYYRIGDNGHKDRLTVTISKAAASIQTNPKANTLTYNGSEQELVTAGVANGGTMKYKLGDDNDDWFTAIPKATNAGQYTVRYMVTGDQYHTDFTPSPNTITVNINQETPEVTPPSAVEGLRYTGSAQTLIYAGSTTGGTMKYSLNQKDWSTSIPTGIDADEYTVYYKVEGDSNYKDVSPQSFKVSIAKAASEITSKPAKKALTYRGDSQALVSAGIVIGGTMKYTLDTVKGSWNTDIPTAKDAGDYMVYFKVEGDKNHTNQPKDSVKAAIAKAASKLTSPPKAAKDLTYTGTAQELVVAGAAEGGTMQYALPNQSYDNAIPKATNVGKYTVRYKVAGDNNHTDLTPDPNSLDVNIAQAALTVTADDKTIIYGEKAPDYTASYQGLVNHEKPEDVLGDLSYSCSYAKGNATGTYTISPIPVTAANYDITFVDGTLTVLQATPTLNEKPKAIDNLIYTGSAQALITAGNCTGGTLKYTMDTTNIQSWSTDVPTKVDAGDNYIVYYKVFGDDNYRSLPIDSVKAEIDKAVAKLSSHPKAKTPTYTGKPQVLIEAGVADGGTILYRLPDGEFAQALPQGTLAGSYTVHYKVVGDNNHYDFTPAPDSLVARVNKASLAIRGDNKAIKYGDPEPAEYTASCTGWVNGEDKSVLRGTLTVTCGYHQWNNAGSYAIVPGGVTADNYAITFKNGTLTVKKAPLTITADDQTVTYGDPAPEYTASYSGWKGQDGPSVLGSSLLFICAYGAGNDAGTYDIQPHGAEATNYNITYANGTLTVNKAIAVVTPPTAIEGLKFTGNPLILINAGHTTGGTLEYALGEQDYSPVLPTATAVGTYTVYYRVNGGTNYNDVGSDSLMVTIAEPDEPTALAPVQAPVSQVQKIIRHDQLIIIRDDNTYTIHGQRID